MERRINVLAVDDTPANLVTLDAVLGDSCNLLRARSGAEAMEILEARGDIDVILMDVQLPGLDGFETAALIKERESWRDIPIVFVTAVFQEDPWVRKGYAVGGIDYFAKPYDPDLLKLKVGIYAEMKQRADFLRARERQLRLSEELVETARDLSVAFEKSETGLLIADMEGNLRQMNEELVGIFRCRKQGGSEVDDQGGALEGCKRFIFDQLGGMVAEVRASRKPRREVLKVRCGDGSERSVLCVVSFLREADSSCAGMAIVIHDVTQSQRVKSDFAQVVAELTAVGK